MRCPCLLAVRLTLVKDPRPHFLQCVETVEAHVAEPDLLHTVYLHGTTRRYKISDADRRLIVHAYTHPHYQRRTADHAE